MVHQQQGADAVITVENITIPLTTDQIIRPIRFSTPPGGPRPQGFPKPLGPDR